MKIADVCCEYSKVSELVKNKFIGIYEGKITYQELLHHYECLKEHIIEQSKL